MGRQAGQDWADKANHKASLRERKKASNVTENCTFEMGTSIYVFHACSDDNVTESLDIERTSFKWGAGTSQKGGEERQSAVEDDRLSCKRKQSSAAELCFLLQLSPLCPFCIRGILAVSTFCTFHTFFHTFSVL